MGKTLRLWDETLLRPILEILFLIAIGCAIGFFLFDKPEYRFAFNANFSRFGEGRLSPQFSFVISGDTAHYIEFEQRNLLRFRTQSLSFLEPSADDSSWGFVELSLPLAAPIPQSLRVWNPATATSGTGQDVFVRLRLWNDCVRIFRLALTGGTELMAGQYRGGPEWFGKPAYFLTVKVPYDSSPTVPSVHFDALAEPTDVAGSAELTRFAGFPGEPKSIILNEFGVMNLGTTKDAAETWRLRFGADRGYSKSWNRHEKSLWIPLMLGEGSDMSEVSLAANVSRLTVRRAEGDLVVGSRHLEVRAASLLQIIPRDGVVRISSAERSFEATDFSSNVQMNGEHLVGSRYEALPPAWQAAAATAVLALSAFLLRDAYAKFLRHRRRRDVVHVSAEADSD